MNPNRSSIPYFAATVLLALLFSASSAIAGPPLLCHSFDIGNAKSLPWISHDWNLTGEETYNINNLIADTIAILDSDPTVLVHMETLRRATLYSQLDPLAAKHLLSQADGAFGCGRPKFARRCPRSLRPGLFRRIPEPISLDSQGRPESSAGARWLRLRE